MPNSENEYRFSISTAPNGDVTVYRGRLYRLPSDWTADSWAHYWDGDGMVAVYDDRVRYNSPTENPDTARVERALDYAVMYEQDIDAMLTRLARRLTGQWYSHFISVGLDGVTLYVLAWGIEGSAEHWRDEIEAVYHGDIYRVEVEEYQPGAVFDNGDWNPADDSCEEWYGEDVATAAFGREFELDEFPADRFAGSDH